MELVNQGRQALVVFGAHGQQGQAQRSRKALMVDHQSKAPCLITHVQRHHHRQCQRLNLQQQPQLAGDLAGVEHHQQQIGRALTQKPLHHSLVLAAPREVVNAWQIHQFIGPALGIRRQGAALQIHGEAGPVSNVRMPLGEGIEQGGLATVGHAQQRHRDLASERLPSIHPSAMTGEFHTLLGSQG